MNPNDVAQKCASYTPEQLQHAIDEIEKSDLPQSTKDYAIASLQSIPQRLKYFNLARELGITL